MIHPQRIQYLNNLPERPGRYILYWMQASQRARFNHALEYAIEQANARSLPVVALFAITGDFPDANARHYSFMLEGLNETRESLAKRGIALIFRHASPERAALELSKDAALVVVDRGYLHIEREWRTRLAEKIDRRFVQVESNVVVPVETASDKEEFSARTIRPKIHKLLETFLVPVKHRRTRVPSLNLNLSSLDISDVPKTLRRLRIDSSVNPVDTFRGGASQAKKHLAKFLTHKLARYPDDRNDPNVDGLSNMSPYLHFGQISPLEIALEVLEADGQPAETYIEELVVRRELSMNFVFYNDSYDRLDSLPQWALDELDAHRKDRRAAEYSLEQWEQAKTHDPYWNAAQTEMTTTGKMHGYMRMYWGKKILEWTVTPEEAYRIALYLNNKYELDGRDENGFTGVAWCFGKHDRAWGIHPVYGKIRYMNANGLRRKFDADEYARRFVRK